MNQTQFSGFIKSNNLNMSKITRIELANIIIEKLNFEKENLKLQFQKSNSKIKIGRAHV